MNDVQIDVKVRGPLFSKRIDETTRRAIYEEVLTKVEQRVMRTPRRAKAGRKNNTLSAKRAEAEGTQSLDINTTLNWPRTSGAAWTRYNVAAIRKLAPNVIRAAGRRIRKELGG